MQIIRVENNWQTISPSLKLACIETDVVINSNNPDLWDLINSEIAIISEHVTTEQISKIPAIQASRMAYKACGKDPARYRLSSEALLRRVVSGKGLYQINNVVDQLNLVSITTGFSIGGYDADKIKGDISFGIGKANEPYHGIGRGELNIEGLPVFRDDIGAFGTPTSDSERTSVTEKTKRFLMIIINFGGISGIEEAQHKAISFLEMFCDAKNMEQTIIACENLSAK